MFYDRELRKDIVTYLEGPEAIIILGSRQVGKTTLLKMIMESIKTQENAFYLDLEDSRNLDQVKKGPENLMRFLSSIGASFQKRNYLFLDEIHYLDNLSRFIKLSVDHYSNKFKVIGTGSSALGIRLKFKEAMVGRKLIFTLYPLSFREFLHFKERKNLAKNLPSEPFKQIEEITRFFKEDYDQFFHEFLIFGGYPRIALESSFEKKTKLLGEIVDSYIYKDIRSLFHIGNIHKFNDLVRVLASQAGSLVNVSELSRTVGISRPTVMNFLSILENSFLISMIPPYSRSHRVEVRKASKIYWLDNGLRNYLINDLSASPSRTDMGILLENAVFTGLTKRKKEMDHLYYWRTKDVTEVDFVCESGRELIPIEVKTHARIHRGMSNFLKKYNVKKGYIAHTGDFMTAAISHIPAYWLA
ncbi:MAG: ATP-binding protein [Acidobacteriota bacterium]